MDLLDPWHEMHKVECQNSEEKKKVNNFRNRLIIEMVSYSSLIDKKKAGILITIFFGILLAPKTCVAIGTYLKDEKSTNLNIWEYSRTYFSIAEWKKVYKNKKLSPEFYKLVLPSLGLILTSGITYLSTSYMYEEVIKNISLKNSLDLQNQLLLSQTLCNSKLIEKANTFKKRFASSNLSWAEVVLKKDIDFAEILKTAEKLCSNKIDKK